jgi:hypothetical protein
MRQRYNNANVRLRTKISPGTVGAIAELAVAVDLMERGYDVFRAVSPACSCDLAVLSGGELLRIEVRTGHLSANGGLYWGATRNDDGRFDVYAVVLHSDPRQIVYLNPDKSHHALHEAR